VAVNNTVNLHAQNVRIVQIVVVNNVLTKTDKMNYNRLRVPERENPHKEPERCFVLQKLIEKHNLKKGAELGVRSGELYYFLLSHCPKLTLIGVDLYDSQPDGGTDPQRKITYDQPRNGFSYNHELYYNFIKELQKEFGARAQFIKDWTSNASLLVEDNSLDFVFIDADHGYKGCFEDIEKWKSKIKLGGFVTGHDIWMSGIQKAVKEHFGNDYKKYPDHVWVHQKK